MSLFRCKFAKIANPWQVKDYQVFDTCVDALLYPLNPSKNLPKALPKKKLYLFWKHDGGLLQECSKKFSIIRAMLKVPPEIENQGGIMTTADAFGIPNKSLRCHRVKDVTWTQNLGNGKVKNGTRREYWTLSWKIRCRWLDTPCICAKNWQVKRKIMSLVVSNLSHCHPRSSHNPCRVAWKFNQKRKVISELFY